MCVSVDGHVECLQLTSIDATSPLSLEREGGCGTRGEGTAAEMLRAVLHEMYPRSTP